MHWIYENSSYPVRIIVPHFSKIWCITVTTFKWLRNKSSLVEDKKTGLTRGCFAHTVKFRSHRLNEHNFEFTTFFASYIRDYVVGAWTAVNKQICMRYQGADIAPAGLRHHNRSIFSLLIPNKHYRTQEVWRYKRARIRFHVTCNTVIVIRDLKEKSFSFLVQDSILSARVNPYSRINWCEKWTIV